MLNTLVIITINNGALTLSVIITHYFVLQLIGFVSRVFSIATVILVSLPLISNAAHNHTT